MPSRHRGGMWASAGQVLHDPEAIVVDAVAGSGPGGSSALALPSDEL